MFSSWVTGIPWWCLLKRTVSSHCDSCWQDKESSLGIPLWFFSWKRDQDLQVWVILRILASILVSIKLPDNLSTPADDLQITFPFSSCLLMPDASSSTKKDIQKGSSRGIPLYPLSCIWTVLSSSCSATLVQLNSDSSFSSVCSPGIDVTRKGEEEQTRGMRLSIYIPFDDTGFRNTINSRIGSSSATKLVMFVQSKLHCWKEALFFGQKASRPSAFTVIASTQSNDSQLLNCNH